MIKWAWAILSEMTRPELTSSTTKDVHVGQWSTHDWSSEKFQANSNLQETLRGDGLRDNHSLGLHWHSFETCRVMQTQVQKQRHSLTLLFDSIKIIIRLKSSFNDSSVPDKNHVCFASLVQMLRQFPLPIMNPQLVNNLPSPDLQLSQRGLGHERLKSQG